MSRRFKILIALILLIFAFLVLGTVTYSSLQNKIAKRLEKGWVIPPLELFSQGIALSRGRQFPKAAVQVEMDRLDWRAERDYQWGEAETCGRLTGVTLNAAAPHCLFIKKTTGGPLLVIWNEQNWTQEIWTGEPWLAVDSFPLFARLITQFFDGQPILQQNTALSEMPLNCLQAATATEDREFLEHGGVSATGIARAIFRNLRARRWAEGGSTITQQLVKNFFLTAKKTIRRKVEEQFLAIMLESQISKDQILEMYLNVIYMGQSGPYQVRGFGSAALYYFDKPLARLDLPECALLAALINNPGRYSPFAHTPAAASRREFVLHKMQDAQMITADEHKRASEAALPQVPAADRRTHAPYFVMSALKEFTNLTLDAEEGARLYTTLDPELQNRLTNAVDKQMPLVAARVKHPSTQPLQVAALTVDVRSGEILALIGGRDFRATQFNRAVDSRRQIGSIVKPFVYYPALKSHDALTEVRDETFEWKTGKQIWRPKDFEADNLGPVPYFFALAHSLNIPAARVGQEVGLDKVTLALHDAGIRSAVSNLPSLTLGALELSPMEVAQGYLTLARLGGGDEVHTLMRVEDPAGQVLYQHQADPEFKLDPAVTAQLVGMMEQSIVLGTARAASLMGLTGAFAGKTGSTSDTKDAWFAGFSPRLLTVVWVGYDDNTVMGLTGGRAALPVWIEMTTAAQKLFVEEDFHWPDSVQVKAIPKATLLEKFPNLPGLPEEIRLVVPREHY